MPSLFVFSVMPHYAHCTDVVAGQDTKANVIDAYKKDKRPCIYKLDLTINTSSSTVPHDATNDCDADVDIFANVLTIVSILSSKIFCQNYSGY